MVGGPIFLAIGVIPLTFLKSVVTGTSNAIAAGHSFILFKTTASYAFFMESSLYLKNCLLMILVVFFFRSFV